MVIVTRVRSASLRATAMVAWVWQCLWVVISRW
ncbi:Uncharacterised protein [Mycobacterium tuberculosis]|uniref:Uncharacterized protein n=1 Tax=Mycobacterium tuberculosis TaxID=1773 RepID=A0A654U1A8_MYCTX|nr:Uncharacterised protein [Mycobacterium tuberculosis]